MAAILSPPRLLPSGDSAITVEFSRSIDEMANQRVLALDRTLASDPITGVTETVPTYRSLLVHYDPVQIDFDTLSQELVSLARLPLPPPTKTRCWRIPVVYGGEHGIDLEDVAKTLKTTPDEIVARHVAGDYRVAMIGFTPGWSYLSGLEKFLHMPRRQNPRLLTPAGTVSIGGGAGGVPGGHGLDRRRAGRRAVSRRPKRLAPAGTDRGANLPVASRSDLPSGTRRPCEVLRGRCQNFCRAGSRRGSRRDHRRADRLMSKLVISSIGPASSVQDGGRHGAQRYGLMPSGAMDRLALAAANCLVGNPIFAAAIEIGPFGAAFTAREGVVRLALAGAPRSADITGRAVVFDTSMTLADGETLTLGFARGGSFSYLAIEGSIEGEPMFGSLAVNARAGLGSPYPRPLQAEDELQTKPASGAAERRIDLPAATTGPIRVLMGPQGDEFGDAAKQLFLDNEWKISATTDSMGYRRA